MDIETHTHTHTHRYFLALPRGCGGSDTSTAVSSQRVQISAFKTLFPLKGSRTLEKWVTSRAEAGRFQEQPGMLCCVRKQESTQRMAGACPKDPTRGGFPGQIRSNLSMGTVISGSKSLSKIKDHESIWTTFTVEEPGRHCFNQEGQIKITNRLIKCGTRTQPHFHDSPTETQSKSKHRKWHTLGAGEGTGTKW